MTRAAAIWLLFVAGTVAMASTGPAQAQLSAAAANGRNGNGQKNGNNGEPAYQDRLIDDGRLVPDIWFGEVREHDASGPPRGLRLDGIFTRFSRNDVSTSQYGVGVGAFLATPMHGSWSFDGVFGNREEASVATLWQRDLPFDGGWRASNGGGNLNSLNIDLARWQPRWFLPTSPMLGASTEWRQAGGAQVAAGVGEPGVYTGLYVPGFRRLGGTLSTVGGQMAVNGNWTAGLQYLGAREVRSVLQPRDDTREFSTNAWFGAAAWQDGPRRLQFNALGSHNSFDGSHGGGWADGLIQAGRYTHGFGAFYLGSNLIWGNQPVGSDLSGAYYRVNYGSRQWTWDAMLDYSAPLGDSGFEASTFFSGSVRYQAARDLGIGGGANARFDGNTAWSAYGFVENTWPMLLNRTQIYVASNAPKRDLTLTASQTWNTPAGVRLATSILAGRFEDGDSASNQFGLSLLGGGDLTGTLAIDANVQWLYSSGAAQPSTLIGTVGFTWRLLPQWSLIGTFYASQTRADGPLQILSSIDEMARRAETRVDDRGAVLILRWETRAGSMAPPLGGRLGAPAGRVVGVVYLDSNEDGRLNAGEQGVNGATVILDDRYSARTDAQGRFEFPAVAAGPHRITVMPDNVPLPWSLANDGRYDIEVTVRGTVNLEVPARRMR